VSSNKPTPQKLARSHRPRGDATRPTSRCARSSSRTTIGSARADLVAVHRGAGEASLPAEFRERFIGVVAHDLRNPLAAVAMTASSLLRKSDPSAPWVR
jgi:signal transduction histidine kinase